MAILTHVRGTTVTVTAPCHICGTQQTVTVPTAGYIQWQLGHLIQEALPTVSDGDREFLISRICDPCFESHFVTDE